MVYSKFISCKLWLFQILVWIGKIVSNTDKARIWGYLFKMLTCSVGGRVLLNDDHKANHQSWSVPRMMWEYFFQPLLLESQILCIENIYKSLTEWLTGGNCLSFFKKIKTELGCAFLPNVFLLGSVIWQVIWNCFQNFNNHSEPLKIIYACL